MNQKHITLVLVGFILTIMPSCQSIGTISPTATEYPYPPSQSTPAWKPKTPTLPPSPTPWPLLDISEETIFIGDDDGTYVAIDVVTRSITSFSLQGNCRTLAKGYKTLCLDDQLYLINLITGDRTEYPITRPSFWSVTPDESLIYYAYRGNDDSAGLFLYNPLRETTTNIALIDDYWPIFPRISAGGQFLIGERRVGSNYLLTMIDIASLAYEEIKGFNGYIQDIEWAPLAQIVAIGSIEHNWRDISGCNSAIISTFDIHNGEIKQLLRATENECIFEFRSFTNNIWSPDGTKIALVVQRSIPPDEILCILDIVNTTQTCDPITGPGESLDHIAWSPDSQALAYIVLMEKNQRSLRVINWNDPTQITLMVDFPFRPWINDFVWVSP